MREDDVWNKATGNLGNADQEYGDYYEGETYENYNYNSERRGSGISTNTKPKKIVLNNDNEFKKKKSQEMGDKVVVSVGVIYISLIFFKLFLILI